jgi:adenine phosphoribosyltransferase
MSYDLSSHIRDIPDFPKKGIVFKDLTTLLKNPIAFREAADQLYEAVTDKNIDKVVAIESRGFIFGSLLAERFNAGFVPVRKPGKLPAQTLQAEYILEYGTDILEIHQDAIAPGERVLLHDDLLATGGTAQAACQLIAQLGGKVVHISFLMELGFLNGKEKLTDYTISSIIKYD